MAFAEPDSMPWRVPGESSSGR